MKQRKVFTRIAAAVVAVLLLAAAVIGSLVTVRAAARTRVCLQAVSTSARGMACIDVDSGRILYSKNADLKLAMASTTKIVTAITVIENAADLNTIIEINPKAVGIEGTSIYLQKGESLSVRDLLFGLMLRSGNDAAAALALHISPTIEAFCQKMQQVALKAGAKDSSFKNPHGLDEEGHYTTARDLALISAYAMKNPAFREIVSTKDAKIPGVEYPRLLHNKNRLLESLDGCVGVKTGFTKKAGRCYVGAREANGMTVVCVVLNCGPMFEDAEEIMKQAADEYTVTRILTADEFINADGGHSGIARESFLYPLKSGEYGEVEIRFNGGEVCVFLRDKLIHCATYNKVKEVDG